MISCKRVFLLLFIYLISFPIKAQVVDHTEIESINKKNSFSAIETLLSIGYPIDSIVFLGHHTIQNFILKKTSLIKEGDTLTEEKMRVAYSRIFNMQLFHTVTISAKRFDPFTIKNVSLPTSKSKALQKIYALFQSRVLSKKRPQTVVVISIEEGINTAILPDFKLLGTNISRWIASPTFNNINISINAIYKNATGYNDLLGFSFGAGFNSFFNLYYYYPEPFRDVNFSVGFGLYYSLEKNLARNYSSGGELILLPNQSSSNNNYAYSIANGSMYFNSSLSDFSYLSGYVKVSYITVPTIVKTSIPLSLISTSDKTVFPILSLSYKNEVVDLLQYPMAGLSFYGSITQYGLPWKNDAINLTRLFLDIRAYLPLIDKDLTLGVRQMTNISLTDNPSPNHERVFFGYSTNIRGYVYRTFEGDNQLLTSFELRYALFPIKVIPFDFSFGLLPSRFQLGCFITAFFDAGNIWYNLSTLKQGSFSSNTQFAFDFSKWKYGYGLGISIVAGYNITLRFDACMNSENQFEFVFSNSVSF